MNALAYYRMSTDDQKDSIPQQKREVLAYCGQHGIEIIASFEDAGKSATTNNRPGLQALIQEAQKSQASAVVCYDLDRLSRTTEIETIAEVWFPLIKAGVKRIITPNRTMDFSSQTDRLLMHMTQSFKNHAESLAIGRRTARGRRELWLQGYWTCHRPPFGYTIVDRRIGRGGHPGAGRLAIVPEQAEIIRSIFDA